MPWNRPTITVIISNSCALDVILLLDLNIWWKIKRLKILLEIYHAIARQAVLAKGLKT